MRVKGHLSVAAVLLLASAGCRNEAPDEKVEKIPLKSICVSFKQKDAKIVNRLEMKQPADSAGPPA